MRISRKQKEENRDRIVNAASKLLLEQGFDGIGVADLMEAAGFTHGGFYNHFDSKETLGAEAAERAFHKRAKDMAKPSDLAEHLRIYLSPLHRDRPDRGCPVAALASDAARQSEAVMDVFAEGIENMIEALEDRLKADGIAGPRKRRTAAINLLVKMVGAVAVARAVPADSDLGGEILATSLKGALNDVKAMKA